MHRRPLPWLKRHVKRFFLRLWLILLAISPVAHGATLARLPALSADPTAVTASGLSSGGYMAEQFSVAYSASLAGVAVVAGGPYGCSRGSVTNAATKCSCPSERSMLLDAAGLIPGMGCHAFSPELQRTLSVMATQANRADIDDTTHLARQRVWLFSGGQDRVVDRALVEALALYHQDMGVPDDQLRHVDLPDAGHGMPSPMATQACDRTASPYLTQCQVDGPGELLKWLYPQATVQSGVTTDGALKAFRQTPYTQGLGFTGLDVSGWVYVPAACETAGAHCKVHVAFHGCEQGQGFREAGRRFGTQFVKGAGYNRWAEGSHLIVLYPQVLPSTTANPSDPYRYNPKGCWDFWGYTQPHGGSISTTPGVRHPFAARSAPQMLAVKRMIDDLLRKP